MDHRSLSGGIVILEKLPTSTLQIQQLLRGMSIVLRHFSYRLVLTATNSMLEKAVGVLR